MMTLKHLKEETIEWLQDNTLDLNKKDTKKPLMLFIQEFSTVIWMEMFNTMNCHILIF